MVIFIYALLLLINSCYYLIFFVYGLLLLNCFIYVLQLLNCFVYRVQDNKTDWEIIFILADLGPHETHVLWFQRDG